MIQLRANDLVDIRDGDRRVQIAILTKQMLFGGHWCYVFHDSLATHASGSGFNAFVDFIVPKREDRITRLSRDVDFTSLQGPELLQQEPTKGEVNFRIWRWKLQRRDEVEYVRFTDSPTSEEREAPQYACFPASFVCELVAREWKPGTSLWVA